LSLTVATRSSRLAIAQARLAVDAIGEEIALLEVANQSAAVDKERFTRGVEGALLSGDADLGVHSAKDLPATMTPGLVIAAVPSRADPRDAWIGPGQSIGEIPDGCRVGTSSQRRRAQLAALRPDLEMVPMAGNVDTRLKKLEAGEVDAVVLAVAGLERLGKSEVVSFVFEADRMIPAAGQGALVVQGRSGDPALDRAALAGHTGSAACLAAERAAVAQIGAGCESPVGFYARTVDGRIEIDGFAGLVNGSVWLRDRVEGDATRPEAAGRELADRMLAAGAREILEEVGP